MGVLDTIDAASPTRRAVPICLDGALQAEWDQIVDQLDDAARLDTQGGSLAMPATSKLVKDLDDLRDRMAASEVTFVFQQIPWEKRIMVQALHPPREKNAMDLVRGFNVETYYPALIRASCLHAIDKAGDQARVPAKHWDKLLGKKGAPGALNFKQVNRLIDAAQYVNDGDTTVPPSARSLLVSQDIGASLAQPSPGTSPRDGFVGGSRRGSPPSSTTKKATSKGRSTGT